MHSNIENLVGEKIPVLTGRASKNNRRILKAIAQSGAQLKYDISKTSDLIYSTVSRRVDDLVKRGYLRDSGTRVTSRGDQSEETQYGLTWKGWVATLYDLELRGNATSVLRNNINTILPDFSVFPDISLNDVLFSFLEVVDLSYDLDEIEVLFNILFRALVKLNTPSIEEMQIWGYYPLLDSYIENIRIEIDELAPEGITGNYLNFTDLLDNQTIHSLVSLALIPMIDFMEAKMIDAYRFTRLFIEFERVINTEDEGKVSDRVKQFIESDFPRIDKEIDEYDFGLEDDV